MFAGVIFDFDGTLVRSHQQVYKVLGELAREYNLRLPSQDELRQMSTWEAMTAMGVKLWQVPMLTAQARKRLAAVASTVQVEPGIVDLLSELRSVGVKVGLVSSNSKQNIQQILQNHSMAEYFNEILAGSSLLGKQRKILKMIDLLKLRREQILYVGDETRDIEACKKIDVACAAVSWGFHSTEKLASYQPQYLVQSPQELRACILR